MARLQATSRSYHYDRFPIRLVRRPSSAGTPLGLEQISQPQTALMNWRWYGASRALLELAKQLGLDRALYSRKEPWVRDCLAMIVGRLLYAGSKLALSNQWKNTTLWEQCGTEGKVDVEAH